MEDGASIVSPLLDCRIAPSLECQQREATCHPIKISLTSFFSCVSIPMLKLHLKGSTSYLLLHARRPSCLMSSTFPSNLTPCKAVTSPQSWLPTARCKTLNAFISCQMLAPVLLAADCESYLSVFNNESYVYAASQYNASNVLQDPISVIQSN